MLKPVTPYASRLYADDTYIIIQSSNVDTRIEELVNVERWAKVNNLTLNRAKCAELVIHDARRKRQLVLPSPLLDVTRVQALKVLGVTINHNLSVSDHVTIMSSDRLHRLFTLYGFSEHTAWPTRHSI